VVVVRSPVLEDVIDAAREEGRLDLQIVDAELIARTQAGGLRQRREGLAYRLAWRPPSLPIRKRVAPASDIPLRRKLIYRTRAHITRWSPRVLRLSRRLERPVLYVRWAGLVQHGYQALIYSRGRLGLLLDRWSPPS
jgi:hypothetical protein